MDETSYKKIESFMLSQMDDSAHDCQHIYRVLYTALDIAKTENDVDYDVLITACLLHDIGRKQQYENSELCHAVEGGKLAYKYLISNDWPEPKAQKIKQCITSHRFRSASAPTSIEAKILFDADKVDVSGAIGIARTLVYTGIVNESLYSVDADGNVMDGTEKEPSSFFQEYMYKLNKLYKNFYTKRGSEIASQRKDAAIEFFENIFDEVTTTHSNGQALLRNAFCMYANENMNQSACKPS